MTRRRREAHRLVVGGALATLALGLVSACTATGTAASAQSELVPPSITPVAISGGAPAFLTVVDQSGFDDGTSNTFTVPQEWYLETTSTCGPSRIADSDAITVTVTGSGFANGETPISLGSLSGVAVRVSGAGTYRLVIQSACQWRATVRT